MPDSVLPILRALESGLQDPSVRRSRDRLSALLHPTFREFGRSGAVYSRAQVIERLLDEPIARTVHARDFAALELAPSLVLLTYRSCHVTADGRLEGHANRSSIWRREASGWQMVFHQGTPTEPFSHDAAERER
jgi:hypothetical protein